MCLSVVSLSEGLERGEVERGGEVKGQPCKPGNSVSFPQDRGGVGVGGRKYKLVPAET